ncbi:uncharacterized protein LOC106142618 isoform X3 [Amyelois transitella]|uniref:uncharacterized protein LOC106142618 isoform X3 n=1 Tax=Amyelois transitella TaxID=680683 RepID=UPI00298F6FAB|nr:uncharacterized protein LOC106142618 isoform X3 [Amyelois transitella]
MYLSISSLKKLPPLSLQVELQYIAYSLLPATPFVCYWKYEGKMTDEIEIEEHDLLDDPTVRNVFPDISRLKQEILDYDYKEGTESKDHNPTTSSSDIHESNNAESLENDVETNLIVPPDLTTKFG